MFVWDLLSDRMIEPNPWRSYDEKPAGGNSVFARFQWVVLGAVARSAQPYYRAHDEPHNIYAPDIAFLASHRISCVISANTYAVSDESRTLLETAQIRYEHLPVPDFGAPLLESLKRAADLIEGYPPTLVFCGYGQGRTGTYVAAWARLRWGLDRFDLEYLRREFGVETAAQAESLAQLAR